MAYRIEIIQTRKAYLYAGTSNRLEALDFAYRFMRNIENLNQLDFRFTKYEAGNAIECTIKEARPGVIQLVEDNDLEDDNK